MREILFKAKRIDNGEWVEGSLIQSHYMGGVRSWISSLDDKTRLRAIATHYGDWRAVEVDTDTICQYTGLTDKNGNKIWENDVVFVTDDEGCSGQVDTGIGEIDYLEGLWYISGRVQNSLYDINKCFQIEVIGNIFDKPELLEGGGK